MNNDYTLKIEYLPLEALKPYERNAREHGERDLKAIEASIRDFGFNDPIGVWGDNIIVEGHGRLLAAMERGLKTVPVIRLDHLTDEERRGYALAHNRTAELSSWNFDLQASELADISSFDMSEYGFSLPELGTEVQTAHDETDGERDANEIECPHCGFVFEV